MPEQRESPTATPRVGRHQRLTRVIAGAAILIGAGLVAVPFTASLFDRTSAASRLADTVRPAMTQAALDAGKSDLGKVQQAYGQFKDALLPSMAADLKEPPAQLLSEVAAQYPDVRAAVVDFDPAVANAQSILGILVDNRARFEAADSIPMRGFPLTATPWMFIGLGSALVLAGLAALRAPRPAMVAVLLIGLAVAILPLSTAMPGKTDDTATLVEALRQPLSPQGAATARAEFVRFNTMVTELDTQVLPGFARHMGMSDAQLATYVGQRAPLLAPGAPDVPRILAKFSGLTSALVAQVDNYGAAAQIPFRWLPWLFVVPGLLLALLAGWSLVLTSRGRRADA